MHYLRVTDSHSSKHLCLQKLVLEEEHFITRINRDKRLQGVRKILKTQIMSDAANIPHWCHIRRVVVYNP